MSEHAKRRLVFVGNGMATMRAVEELTARPDHGWSLSIYGDEPAYDRIQLPRVLAAECTGDDIALTSPQWHAEHAITLHDNTRIVGIDPARRQIIPHSGQPIPYDHLVLATGSRAILPPVPGHALENVLCFRTLADVEHMRRSTGTDAPVIVVGGGLLGLEAAAALARAGNTVSLIHLMPHLMERQLNDEAAAFLQAEMARQSVTLHTGTSIRSIEGQGRVEHVVLENGLILPASRVIFAIGIRPDITLARDAGLQTGRGILVDDQLRTSDPAISALGECVEHRGQTYGLVAPVYDMARVLATTLAGQTAAYTGSPCVSTKLKVAGSTSSRWARWRPNLRIRC